MRVYSCAGLPVLIAMVLTVPTFADETTWAEYYRIFSRNDTVLDNALPNSELFPAKVDHRWGLVDQRGVLTALPRFQWTDDGIDGRARAIANGKTGYIDGLGNWLIDPNFTWLDRFSDGLAVFRERGREGLIDQRGRVVLPPRYEAILRFHENYAAVQLNGRIGFINRTMKETIAPQFAVARSFHQGLAAVQFLDRDGTAGDWGYINVRGDVQWRDTTGTVTELRDFNDNLAAFQMRSPDGTPKWGYLSRQFQIAIPARFDQARDFTDHLAAVATRGTDDEQRGWGYINRSGDWELAPQFDWADDFDDRLAMIRYQGQFGFIDRQGKTGLFPEFADAEPFERGYATVSDGTNIAYVNANGGVLFDPANLTNAQERNTAGTLGRKGPSLRGEPILDRTLGTRAFFARYPRQSAVPYRRLYLEDGGGGDLPVPYEPEYRYEERLPKDTPGGLLPPDPPDDPAVQANEENEPGTEDVEPEFKGIVPEAME